MFLLSVLTLRLEDALYYTTCNWKKRIIQKFCLYIIGSVYIILHGLVEVLSVDRQAWLVCHYVRLHIYKPTNTIRVVYNTILTRMSVLLSQLFYSS